MTAKHVGYAMVIVGIPLQIVESMAKQSAILNNTNFSDSSIGKLVQPVENFLPVSLGFTLVIVGVGLIWLGKG